MKTMIDKNKSDMEMSKTEIANLKAQLSSEQKRLGDAVKTRDTEISKLQALVNQDKETVRLVDAKFKTIQDQHKADIEKSKTEIASLKA